MNEQQDPATVEKLRLFRETLAACLESKAGPRSLKPRQLIPETISRAREIVQRDKGRRRELAAETLAGWKQLRATHAKRNEATGHLFNPLRDLPISEPVHSRLLGDLLDPDGSHGQGRLLLEAFLREIDVPEPSAGTWSVSVESGYVDICLWRREPASVVIIENKSNLAVDQAHQLYRYWHSHIHSHYPLLDYSHHETRRSFQILYLPPTAGKQPLSHSLQCPDHLSGRGLPATLKDVGVTVKVFALRDLAAGWLASCAGLVPVSNIRLRTYLEFYRELWH